LLNGKYQPFGTTQILDLYVCDNNAVNITGSYYTLDVVNVFGGMTIKVYGSVFANIYVINGGYFMFGYIKSDIIYSSIQPSCNPQAQSSIQVPDILLMGKSDSLGNIFGYMIVTFPQQSSKSANYITLAKKYEFCFC